MYGESVYFNKYSHSSNKSNSITVARTRCFIKLQNRDGLCVEHADGRMNIKQTWFLCNECLVYRGAYIISWQRVLLSFFSWYIAIDDKWLICDCWWIFAVFRSAYILQNRYHNGVICESTHQDLNCMLCFAEGYGTPYLELHIFLMNTLANIANSMVALHYTCTKAAVCSHTLADRWC